MINIFGRNSTPSRSGVTLARGAGTNHIPEVICILTNGEYATPLPSLPYRASIKSSVFVARRAISISEKKRLLCHIRKNPSFLCAIL